jgi:hypothetical protein
MAKAPTKRRAAKKSPGVPTVERKIHFYRIHSGTDEAGKPLPFDPIPALQHIHSMPFDDARYMPSGNGAASVIWIDDVKKHPHVRMGDVRRNGLPSIERKGKLSPLDIPDGAGIAEQTHVVFFPDNIVGVEFNFYGPRAGRLITYLMSKASDKCPEFELNAILRQDVKERLKKLQDLTLFHLKMRASFADTLAQANQGLGDGFKAAAEAGDAEEVEVVLKVKRGSKNFLKAGLKSVAEFFAGKSEVVNNVSKFEVKGIDSDSGKADLVDVLSDDLIAKKQIVLQDEHFRSLNSDSAYKAIEEAYTELKADLLKAAGVTA